jgi:hypothetical protein
MAAVLLLITGIGATKFNITPAHAPELAHPAASDSNHLVRRGSDGGTYYFRHVGYNIYYILF